MLCVIYYSTDTQKNIIYIFVKYSITVIIMTVFPEKELEESRLLKEKEKNEMRQQQLKEIEQERIKQEKSKTVLMNPFSL